MAAPTSSALLFLWRMGGKVFDLPGDHLDLLAAMSAVSRNRPAPVVRAQELLDIRYQATEAKR